ncbi:pyridoxal phosphate-dependent aminotransferase [Candidatus Peregrinibacteria bacterium]|jgi:aspartate aminotransferase|nr:pyridoxal phosphate-dependent aminotransferase [Candidatus Peregrinibacteria bacterium]MBT7484455.1 pyridoxal phosphate-dependent aminotransferase [Candidatus Peregrinibacteria bacterium]MBT7703104.1 pyridoxal phosphate-dependent aminotransferase [Candidatus Peregrinibacteria bacterium]
MKPFSKRMPHLGTENAFAVITKAKKFERESGINLVYLQIGEPGFDTPDNIKQATIKAIEGNETHYTPTPGIPTLRQAIADLTSENACVKYEPTDVVVVPGGKPVMFYLMSALLDEGDEVIIPNPSYPIYGSVTEYLGGKVVPIQLKEENDFNFTIEALEAKITDKTKLIMVNSPQNPTGGVYTRELLEGIAKLAVKHDLWVLSDEIYDRMVHDGEHVSITSFEGMPERTVVLNGCSKTYAMTGYRIGWSVCKNQQMTAYIEQLACNDTSCTNTMAQYAALEAITGPQDQVEYMLEEYKKRRDLMVELVNNIPGMSCHSPKGAFYLMVNVREILDKFDITSAELCERIMREAHVLILPGTVFGLFGEDLVRFSYVSSEEDIRDGLTKIKKYIESVY